jgi:DNA-binding GntR family transcriptional regulator
MSILLPSPRDLAIASRATGRLYPPGHYAVILSAGRTLAPPHVAEVFGIEPGTAVIRRVRVHHDAEDIPLSVSTSWFSATVAAACPALLERQRVFEGTTNYIATQTGVDVVRGRDVVTAVAASRDQAELLDVPVGSPVQRVTTSWFTADDVVVEFGESLMDAEYGITYDYSVTPIDSAGSSS